MDRLTSWMVRSSLCWLLAGIVVGAMMMADNRLPGAWRVWMGPTHGHMLFVGWFLQFALGIGYWLLPRTRTPERPLGYDERLAFGAMAALHVGLLLRVAAEPAQRSGHDSGWIDAGLIASGLLQVLAIAIFVLELWPRLAPRQRRSTPAPAGRTTTAGK